MRHITIRLFLLFFILALASCSTDDATRSNNFLELTSIRITTEHDGIADQTDNQFTAIGDYSGEYTKDITAEVLWRSSDSGILAINSVGLAAAVSPGTVMVTAESGDVSSSIPFTVSSATITSLTVTPSVQDAPIGVERDFDANGNFNDGTMQNLDRIASWESLDPIVAGVTGTGTATGLAVGSADIQAEWQNIKGTATLNVTEAVLTSLAITPANAEYPVGLIIQYELTGSYSDGSTEDLTAQAFWEVDNETRASVENTAGIKGQVETLASGSTDIIASYSDTLTGNWEVSTDVDINTSTLREILISAEIYDSNNDFDREEDDIQAGDTLDIYEDEAVQFIAKGEYTDSEEYPITTQVTWASSDSAIATISNSDGFEGIATPGNETGETTISASFEALELEFTLDVNRR